MKNLILLIGLSALIASCSTTQIKEIKNNPSYPLCFVKWEVPEHKEKYIKGLDMSRVEKIKNELLFPLWKNGGIIIQEKIGDSFIVAFDMSESSQREYVEKIVNQNFIVSPNLMKELMFASWIIKEKDLSKMLKDHEQVVCNKYLDSQFM